MQEEECVGLTRMIILLVAGCSDVREKHVEKEGTANGAKTFK